MASVEQEDNWVLNIRDGGDSRRCAIADIYDELAIPLCNFFSLKVSSSIKADDLVQDVFIKVITKIDTFKGDARFSAWVWAIARNELKMYYRSNTKVFTDVDAIDAAYHCDLVSDSTKELKDCVQKGLINFESKHKERAYVLRLISRHEWQIKDVAEFLDRTMGATREYLSQCRKKVKPFIAECFDLMDA